MGSICYQRKNTSMTYEGINGTRCDGTPFGVSSVVIGTLGKDMK